MLNKWFKKKNAAPTQDNDTQDRIRSVEEEHKNFKAEMKKDFQDFKAEIKATINASVKDALEGTSKTTKQSSNNKNNLNFLWVTLIASAFNKLISWYFGVH